MKQQKKRGDLVSFHLRIPQELYDWITDVCNQTEESKSACITRLLASIKKIQNNLPE